MTERALVVCEAGLLTTVQDLGRPGWGALGIPAAGALDAESLRLANLLAGNDEGAAGLEITLVGPVLEARGDVTLAVAGGTFGPAPGRATVLRDGERIVLRAESPGIGPARAVVAVAGGIAVPEILKSRSTCVVARFGGLHGWPLRKGDLLPVGTPKRPPRLDLAVPDIPVPADPVLRVLPGPQADLFGDEAVRTFYGSAYRIRPESNRIGFRLEGPSVRGDLRGDRGAAVGGDGARLDPDHGGRPADRPSFGAADDGGLPEDRHRPRRGPRPPRPGAAGRFAPLRGDDAGRGPPPSRGE